MDADVLIVGAGPAGAAAAHDLASAGLRVLMLDRRGFPGTKPCAGGVTAKTLARLRFSIDPVVREVVNELDMSLYGRRRKRFRASAPVCVMTHRPELDAFCLEQARRVGAGFRYVDGIEALEQSTDAVSLRLRGGETLRARWLVGADGAHSRVRRLLFGDGPPAGAMAIEGLLPREACRSYPVTRFDFGAIAGGYGWLFPKGDHVNVGLYVWRRDRARPTRQALAGFARHSLGSDALDRVQGYPLGTWAGQVAPGRGRVLLAGDAAGLVEALLGEGIYGAVVSGQHAAAAILGDGDAVTDYGHLSGVWRDEAARMRPLAAAWYGTLPLAFGVLKHALGRPLMQAFARGQTLGQGKRTWLGAGVRPADAGAGIPQAYNHTSGERPD